MVSARSWRCQVAGAFTFEYASARSHTASGDRDPQEGRVSWRFQFYRWFRDSPGAGYRWTAANLVVIAGLGTLALVMDAALGDLDVRWGLAAWFAGILAFAGVLTFNTVLNMMGIGYDQWKAKL